MAAATSYRKFRVVPERSAVVVEAESNMGPILFATDGLQGDAKLPLDGDRPSFLGACARLEVPVDGLSSGNPLYDSELPRQIDARRYPSSTIALRAVEALAQADQFRVTGDITFHGVTHTLAGEVTVDLGGRIVVTGEQLIDIRDFGMSPPTMLLLRINPQVRVHLHVEADAEVSELVTHPGGTGGGTAWE